jgi:hypothetical protein
MTSLMLQFLETIVNIKVQLTAFLIKLEDEIVAIIVYLSVRTNFHSNYFRSLCHFLLVPIGDQASTSSTCQALYNFIDVLIFRNNDNY